MMYNVPALILLVLGNVIPRSLASSNTKYGRLCIVDLEHHEDFPVIEPNRGLLEQGESIAARVKSDRELSALGSKAATSPLYLCTCDEETTPVDERLEDTYCPIGFICGIPLEGGPVECISGQVKALTGIARMAWPVLLITSACLLLVLLGSHHGLALARYLKKRCCCRGSPSLEDIENGEIDKLLEVARLETPPERPSRKQIIKFQLYQYNSLIIREATVVWRRFWKNYVKTHKDLYLKTKKYESDSTVDASTRTAALSDDFSKQGSTSSDSSRNAQERDADPELGSSFENNSDSEKKEADQMLSISASSSADSSADSESCSLQQDNEVTCSICFGDIEAGQKIGDLKCGHVFHAKCLKEWLVTGRRNTCPLCQVPNIATRERCSSSCSSNAAK